MFLLIPVGVEYSARRYPVVTFTIMGVNVAIYLVSLVAFFMTGGDSDEWIIENFWLTPANSVGYTYLTSLFVHEGFFHLLGNMIYLFLFGSCVEDIIGRWKYLVFYLIGGLAADFTHILATPEGFASDIPLGGASGAVSACIGAYVLLLHRTKIEFKYIVFIGFRFFVGEFFLAAWLVISFWFLKDLAFAILTAMRDASGGGVAFAAHVGGFVAGMAMIGANKGFLKLRPPPPDQEELVLQPVTISHQQQATVYLYEGEAQSGPFTYAQVRQMLALGAISVETLYWEDGMPEWRTVTELTAPPG
jgi:membrane associated rhomboid family serine protease